MPGRYAIEKIMNISSEPIIIGQACEFGYSGTQAYKTTMQTLNRCGVEAVKQIEASLS